ncbi:MAG: PH domain-containing protein [Micrococcales bacterium]|nr:PH domain-containing protein [Micrococcales bacterium]
MPNTSPSDWTYRPRSAIPTVVAIAVVAAGLAFAQAVSGGPRALGQALPFAAAGALAGWLCFGKPSVTVADAGIHVVNPIAVYDVPWAALILVRTQYTCTFVTPHRSVRAFAAPGPGRYAAMMASYLDLRDRGGIPSRGTADLGALPTAPSGQVATVVQQRWNAMVETGTLPLGEADDTVVARRLDLRALVVLGALIVLGVVLQLAL